jgi:hypothetical protein
LIEIKASDRTYVQDAKGTLRVLDYNINGVENSDVYVAPPAPKPKQPKS